MDLKCIVFVALSIFLGVQAAPENLIISGENAVLPYACRIISLNGPTASTESGRLYSGFFFKRNRVVTVALALEGFDNWRIEYGPDLSSYTTSRHKVIHEGYVRDTLLHNVGYLELEDEVDSTIVTSIPFIVEAVDGFLDIYGYGTTEYQGAVASNLQRVFMTITDRATCLETFGTHIANQQVICGNSFSDNQGICNGDTGGPVLQFPTANNVIAISSFWSGRCNETTTYGFVALFNYLEFLSLEKETKF